QPPAHRIGIKAVLGRFLHEIADDSGREERGAARTSGGRDHNGSRTGRRRIVAPVLLHPHAHRFLERHALGMGRATGRLGRVDATHGMIVAEHDRERGDQHEEADDEGSTQLPTGAGKIRQNGSQPPRMNGTAVARGNINAAKPAPNTKKATKATKIVASSRRPRSRPASSSEPGASASPGDILRHNGTSRSLRRLTPRKTGRSALRLRLTT